MIAKDQKSETPTNALRDDIGFSALWYRPKIGHALTLERSLKSIVPSLALSWKIICTQLYANLYLSASHRGQASSCTNVVKA